MDRLIFLLDRLKKSTDKTNASCFIPEAWNTTGFDGYTADEKRPGEIRVNPYGFAVHAIEYCIKNGGHIKAVNTEKDLAGCTIYSMFPRFFTAWKHGDSGVLSPGTFLKAICLLPMLKKLNVDIVYLLPVFQSSRRYKKGDLGSPYSIKNVYKIDRTLHDGLLGQFSDEVISAEFGAFVEACHLMGMRVMLDFAFRTVSRDSDLIAEHPDWFYWIDLKKSRTFTAPYIEGAEEHIMVSDGILDRLYNSAHTREYLSGFTFSPDVIDPARWNRLKECRAITGDNILDLVEKNFGITTVPGFSDVINDRQPPWTDATYLRYYFDNDKRVEKYIPKGQAPYIMQDGVSLNLYHGNRRNRELWDYIAGVIPYYEENYGIDGARIDMGHALPDEVNREIVERVKSKNSDFLLWSEEFNPDKAETAKENGFHFISGATWSDYKNVGAPDFLNKLVSGTLLFSALPITAALETADTPRAAHVFRDRKKLKLLIFLNSFLPNVVPFINNGIEVMEAQPMNLGLDNTEEGRFVLDRGDKMYGKLAFFDNCCLHWLNPGREWMMKQLADAAKLRAGFIDIISEKDNFIACGESLRNDDILVLCYFDAGANKGVFFLGSRNFKFRTKAKISRLLPEEFLSGGSVDIVYRNGGFCRDVQKADGFVKMDPGEVTVGCVGYRIDN